MFSSFTSIDIYNSGSRSVAVYHFAYTIGLKNRKNISAFAENTF